LRQPILFVIGRRAWSIVIAFGVAVMLPCFALGQAQKPAVTLVSPIPPPTKSADTADIVQAVIRDGGTSLQLSPARMHLYAMVTGGAAPSGPFATGQYAQAMDTAGQLSAALAYGANDQNGYTTQTGYHVIGGVSVGGSWDSFNAYQSSNSQPGAPGVSINFKVSSNSLVVVVGLASSQQQIALAGIPNLQTDALNSGPSASEAMIISHAYLPPGTYTLAAQSAALSAGQDPNYMADLIGVFVFSGQRSSFKPPALPASNPPPAAVKLECTGPGDAAITNNTHGTIRVLSGTGAFSTVSSSNKRIAVAPGDAITGTLNLQVLNNGPGFAVAPLIWTSSWGADSTSWRLISQSVQPGQQDFTVQIAETVPQNPGEYHIIFALQLETNGASVASGTNWARSQPVWEDGNDIAEFNPKQIGDAQNYGCAIDNWLLQGGPHPFYVPADAITVTVQPAAAIPSVSSQLSSTARGDIRTINFRNFEYHSDVLNRTITLQNGKWSDDSGDFFTVSKIAFGDLLGNGSDDAVVWTETALGGTSPNLHQAEIFVFFMSSNSPTLLGNLWPSDPGRGEEVDWTRLTDIGVGKRQLNITFQGGDCNACTDWIATASFAWNGGGFVRTGVERHAIAPQQ